MPETKTNVVNRKDFKKYKEVAAQWGVKDADKVKQFMIAMNRINRTVPGVGGPRPMIIRDRNHHTTGDNLMLNPIAADAAYKLFLVFLEKESK